MNSFAHEGQRLRSAIERAGSIGLAAAVAAQSFAAPLDLSAATLPSPDSMSLTPSGSSALASQPASLESLRFGRDSLQIVAASIQPRGVTPAQPGAATLSYPNIDVVYVIFSLFPKSIGKIALELNHTARGDEMIVTLISGPEKYRDTRVTLPVEAVRLEKGTRVTIADDSAKVSLIIPADAKITGRVIPSGQEGKRWRPAQLHLTFVDPNKCLPQQVLSFALHGKIPFESSVGIKVTSKGSSCGGAAAASLPEITMEPGMFTVVRSGRSGAQESER